IKDFAVDVVEAMIRFFYSFEYDVPADTSAMIFHAKVYQIGDKYGIETLKKQALNKFKDVFVEAEVTADYANDLADTITVLMPETSFKEGLARNGDFSTDLISFINENMEDCWDCKCLSCKYVFAFRIQSSGVIFPALQNPTPIRCPLYGWKPPADTDGDWPKESSDRVIEIMDFDPTIVEAMARFIYCFGYESPADTSAMVFHAKVYQIADKYGIEALKRLSASNYRTSIDEGWEAADFPTAIALAYITTPPEDRGLRDIAVDVAVKRLGTLMNRDTFRETLSDNTDLAADIIRFMHRKWGKVGEYKCSICERVLLLGFPEFQDPVHLRYCPTCSSCNNSW
ncbi:hypothetical protein H9L39_17279, partial [Fusarium oxysporum f. sp. albedinis]